MTRILSLFVVFMLSGALAFSQSRVVTGKVTTENGAAVPFASISIKGAKNAGTVADDNGAFSLKAKTGDVLLISGNGVKTDQVTVGASSVVNASLTRSSAELTSVVVTALGQKQKSNAIGYSVSTVRTAELNQAKVVNLQNGLTGKVAGLSIQSANSSVFGDTRITLRGIRSLTGNNQALLVVDGIPVSLNFISTINPNDVADVSVLKSNAAAILYGQDGANGAIVVTTKRGSRSKPTITIGSTVQFETINALPDLQHEFGLGETEDANGLPIYDYFTNNSFGPRFDGSLVNLGSALQNGARQKVVYSDRGNERFTFFDKGVTLQNDLSLSGGDEKSRYYLSLQDANIKGTMPKDKNRRTTFRVNASREFSRLTTSVNLNYSLSNYDVVSQNRGGFDDIYTSVIKTGGHVPLTSYKDWKNNPYATPDGYYNYFGYNPYMLIDIDRRKGRIDNILASTDLSYKLSSAFTLNYRLGTTVRTVAQKTQQGAINFSAFKTAQSGQQSTTASVTDFSNTSNRINSDLFLTFKKQVGKISIDGLIGNSVIQRSHKELTITGNNLVIPTLFNVNNRTGEAIVNEFIYKVRTVGNYGKLGFGYDNKIFVEFAGRNDKDSRLPQAKNSFFYPSVNGSLVINEMIPALKDSRFISLLKLRANYAKSGNVNLGSTDAEFQGAYQLSPTFLLSGSAPYGSGSTFSAADGLRDPNIRPEFITTKEIGLEVRLNKNRISFEAAYYTQNNTDQILDVSLAPATGYSASRVNAASFVNKGYEFDLNLTPLISLGKWNFNIKANYSFNDNKVNSVYQDLQEILLAGTGNRVAVALNKPAYVLKLTDFKRDDLGRVIVGADGSPSAASAPKQFGNTLPKHTLAISPTISVGNLSLTVLMEYRGGNYIYADQGGDLVFNGIGSQTTTFGRQPFIWPNSVYDDGTGKFVPNTSRTTTSGNANFWATSLFANNIESLYYSKADFWKMREVSLSYSFPETVLSGQNTFKAASITFSGRNLFIWKPKSNQWGDPEQSQTTGNGIGIQNTTANAPSTRTMGVTVSLTF
jgi:TonB-linked SusC/RagA family outer membrane protein